jgi:glycine/D-amino acid oxidase-like deaminating enzyme
VEAAPPARLAQRALARRCAVVIVGAGYTGLSAGLTLARAGRSVQISTASAPGKVPRRNGGIASGNLRPSYNQMRRKFGEARAQALLAEAKAAREELAECVKRENIDCDFRLVGRFTGAARASEYERLAREADHLRKTLRIEAHAVPKAAQRGVLGTDFYDGGLLRADIGGLHPAKFFAAYCRPLALRGRWCMARPPFPALPPRLAVLRSRQCAGPSRPTTSSLQPTAIRTAWIHGGGRCRCAAVSWRPPRSRTI